MTLIPIDENDIAPARALRTEFARFWSTARGERRDMFDEFIGATPRAPGVIARTVTGDAEPGCWVEPAGAQSGRAILLLHGGSYAMGRPAAFVGVASQIAVRARAPVFVLEYPLAPDATLPVARDLAAKTVERLTSQFASVAIVGDSAGGGLRSPRRSRPVDDTFAYPQS